MTLWGARWQLGGSLKDRQHFLEAKRARRELKELLAKPMRKQAFGKFLPNKGLKEAIQAENEVKPYIVNASAQGKKKKKKSMRAKVSLSAD